MNNTFSEVKYKKLAKEDICQRGKYHSFLFKYRSILNNNDDFFNYDNLLNSTLYFQNPLKFEDKEDCRLSYIMPNNDFQMMKILQHYLTLTKNSFTMTKLNSFFSIKEFEILYNNNIGILSMTYDPLNDYMWKKYSSDYTGYCMGFQSEYLFSLSTGGSYINYCKELPSLIPEPFGDSNIEFLKQIYCKLKKWVIEKEYRLEKFSYQFLKEKDRIVQFDRNELKYVLIGNKMPQNLKIILINKIIADYPYCSIYIVDKTNNFIINRIR